MSIVALLQGWPAVLPVLRAITTASFWKSRSSFTSGLLDRSNEAQPLNAASPSAPVTPLIITMEPLSRASALAVSGAGNRSGASILISVGIFCRSIGVAGGEEEVRDLANHLISQPRQALAGAKRAVNHALTSSYEDAMEFESYLQEAQAGSAEFAEGVQAFLARRASKK